MLPKNPRAVITGAGGGLGRAFSMELARRGASLLLSDVDLGGLEETKRLVEGLGAKAFAMRCDVTKAEEVEAMRGEAYQKLGDVDLVVNNAGVAVAGQMGAVPLSDWAWIMGVNLWGVIHGCHFFLPRMKERRSGHVLNVASIAGIVYAPEMGPYNATKAAVVAISETLAAELAGSGVGVTVLCPWFFKTNILASSRQHGVGVDASNVEKLMGRAKLQAEDVARLALEGCDKGKLHVLPHTEAKVLSLIKRSIPALLQQKLAPIFAERARGKIG